MDELVAGETLDAVVAETLAFLDTLDASDGHTSDDTDTEPPPSAHHGLTRTNMVSPLAALRTALHNLHTKLVASDRSIHCSSDSYDGVTHDAIGTSMNWEAREIQRRLELCQRLLVQWLQRPATRMDAIVLEEKTVEMALGRRLDQVFAHVASGTSDRPLLNRMRPFDDISTGLFDDPTRGAAVRIRSGRYVPFKLSLLSKAAWQNLIATTLSYPGDDKVASIAYATEMFFRLYHEEENTRGVVALRRAQLPDGSVLFYWACISAAPRAKEYAPANLIGDCVAEHYGWIRVGVETNEAFARPRVYLESVGDVVVQPPAGSRERPEINLRRYTRFKESIAKLTGTSRNPQLMENKMLEWSSSDS